MCFSFNTALAFDPYADEEIEKKSNKKLYYGIVLTLIGGFLAYDGFSKETVDISKPQVDYETVIHAEWYQNPGDYNYEIRSGCSKYTGSSDPVIQQNVLFNTGNVDLTNVTVEIAYLNRAGEIVKNAGDPDYHTVVNAADIKKGESLTWQDIYTYVATMTNPPGWQQQRQDWGEGEDAGIYKGESATEYMDIKIDLSNSYTPIYEKRNKSDIEGAAGIVIGISGIYLIVDHFLDLNKFNQYMKRNDLDIKLAKAQNEYKILLQKRI